MKLRLLRSTAAATAATAAFAGPFALALAAPADAAGALPKGVLVSARAALSDWSCGTIADQKFACYAADEAAGGFTVVQRTIRDLPKWQEDATLAGEVAVVRKRYFLTVQPTPELSAEDLASVKDAISPGRS